MALYKTHQGSFVSRMGNIIRCEIWCNATTAPATVGELTFPYDSPLTIEWDADSKRETIQGSTATLTVVSPGDRTYIDLYTTVAGSVQLRVYRNNVLFWSGTLDTEHYEEPFSQQKNYDVTFTFTDFGILSRLRYNLTGRRSVYALVSSAVSRASVQTVATVFNMSTTPDYRAVYVDSANFTDEDGETLTLAEAIEGALAPLDLHLRQWNGKVRIFDSHTAAQQEPQTVTWCSDDQLLSVDEVFNSAKVTFSPYATDTLLSADLYHSLMNVDTSLQNLTTRTKTSATPDGKTYAYSTWYVDNKEENRRDGEWDYNYIGFTLYVLRSESPAADRGITYSTALTPVHFECTGNGESCDALLRYARLNYHVKSSGTGKYGTQWAYRQYPQSFTPIITMPRFSIESQASASHYMLLKLPLMLSAAYNPFTTECDVYTSNVEKLSCRAGYVLVPFRMRLYNQQGTVTHHYSNTQFSTTVNPTIAYTRGAWVEGDYTDTIASADSTAWLSYHSMQNRKTTNGIDGGWADNRHFVGLSRKEAFESLKNADAGQYIPLPPQGGQIGIEIMDGIYIYDWGNTSADTTLLGATASTTQALYSTINWHAYKQPTVSLVSYTGGRTTDVAADDIEYRGTLEASAKDELTIDTICGTAPQPIVGARGIYTNASGNQITQFTRNGRTDTVEQLLIGTLHSHYATRHAKLTGTMLLDSSLPLIPVYTDTTLQLPMIATSMVADLRADEMEATLIETNTDCYMSN